MKDTITTKRMSAGSVVPNSVVQSRPLLNDLSSANQTQRVRPQSKKGQLSQGAGYTPIRNQSQEVLPKTKLLQDEPLSLLNVNGGHTGGTAPVSLTRSKKDY